MALQLQYCRCWLRDCVDSAGCHTVCWQVVVYISVLCVLPALPVKGSNEQELPACCLMTVAINSHSPTLTNRLLYLILFIARPFGFFFFSCFATFGVCPLTLPARAKDPCTLPVIHTNRLEQNRQHVQQQAETAAISICKPPHEPKEGTHPWWL